MSKKNAIPSVQRTQSLVTLKAQDQTPRVLYSKTLGVLGIFLRFIVDYLFDWQHFGKFACAFSSRLMLLAS